MKTDAFKVVRDFESALCQYTGAPYAVAVNSCSMALLLAVAWQIQRKPWTPEMEQAIERSEGTDFRGWPHVEIPKRTYVSVPMSIIHAGGRPTFRDEEWKGSYRLRPLPVWDSARRFTRHMYLGMRGSRTMLCVSFHWSKILGIQQGGAILHDDPEADAWLRRARFDGRTEGVAPKDESFDMIGWHCYMSPEIAAAGLVRLSHLPDDNPDLPNDEYPDLSTMEIFK